MFNKTHKQRLKLLPENKKLIHCGYLFKIWQWSQKQFDGSYKTYELAECRDASLVIAEMQGEIYFTKQKQSGIMKKYFYSLIGGYIEDNQTKLQAAKAELLQEAGMASDDWEEVYQNNPNDKFAKTDYYYIARNCKIVAKQELDSGEKIILQHMPIEEFIRTMPFKENMRDAHVLRAIFCHQFSQTDINNFKKMFVNKNGKNK